MSREARKAKSDPLVESFSESDFSEAIDRLGIGDLISPPLKQFIMHPPEQIIHPDEGGFISDVTPLAISEPIAVKAKNFPFLDVEQNGSVAVSMIDAIYDPEFIVEHEKLGLVRNHAFTPSGYAHGFITGSLAYLVYTELGLVQRPDILRGATDRTMAHATRRFGFRTAKEWAQINTLDEQRNRRLQELIERGDIDGPDIEVFGMYPEVVEKTLAYARAHQEKLLKRALRVAQKTLEL